MAPKAQTKLQKDISKKQMYKDIPPVSESESNNSSGTDMDFFISSTEK